MEEDVSGEPFVGPSGEILDKFCKAMGLMDGDFYVINAVKCRPEGNRTPAEAELKACYPVLVNQLNQVKPQVIIALGKTAVRALGLDTGTGWRGKWQAYETAAGPVPVMATYHPSFLLREPSAKAEVGKDLFQVLKRLGRK